tara:strand:+ start:231 stop:503 length:273 start_codon:yes stop_codon:yes gene_type:complete
VGGRFKMYSIGDLIDKLVIENIKIFNLREKIHEPDLSDEVAVNLNNKMIVLNENRGTISDLLDEKVERVVSKKEKNVILKKLKTYDINET